ncbi:MAG: carbon storage regulator CsrA [Actinomycetota bacterium]|jgi:carbon storage regulator|nr:carbon storage regulator CsrA [Actinomycetota bacterium]
MLVLTRRVNESIVIGNDIVVTVLEVQRDSIRLGIKAPHDVEINREEIFLLLSDKTRDAGSIAAETSRKLHSTEEEFIGERAGAGA